MPIFTGVLASLALAVVLPAVQEARQADDEDGYVEIDLCTIAPERRVETQQQWLQDAWYDLDVHGRAFTGSFNPHSANFGKEPIPPDTQFAKTMEWRHLKIQQLLVKTGGLFPQFNHPMDVPMLLDRLRTHSIPAFDLDDPMQPGHTSMLEVFLTAAPDNAEIGYEFVEAMGELEGHLLSLKSGHPAPGALASITRFQEAFPPFMAASKGVVFSPALTETLTWRMAHMCEWGEPAEETSE